MIGLIRKCIIIVVVVINSNLVEFLNKGRSQSQTDISDHKTQQFKLYTAIYSVRLLLSSIASHWYSCKMKKKKETATLCCYPLHWLLPVSSQKKKTTANWKKSNKYLLLNTVFICSVLTNLYRVEPVNFFFLLGHWCVALALCCCLTQQIVWLGFRGSFNRSSSNNKTIFEKGIKKELRKQCSTIREFCSTILGEFTVITSLRPNCSIICTLLMLNMKLNISLIVAIPY